MKSSRLVLFSLSALLLLSAGNSFGEDAEHKPKVDPRIGGMRLLPDYQHIKLQGIDSIVGKIEKPDGLSISYEIGGITPPGAPRFGGGFTDRPFKMPAQNRQWYKEQTINGMPVHLAYTKDGVLMVSIQNGLRGINFSTKAKDAEEVAEALLMILTYPQK